MVHRAPFEYPRPPRALITLADGSTWPGVLRRRSWWDELGERRWSVDVYVEGGRLVQTWVGAGQIDLVDDEAPPHACRPGLPVVVALSA